MKVLIADDHQLILEGLTTSISKAFDGCIIENAIDKNKLFALLPQRWDILVLDIRFGEHNAADFISEIRDNYSQTKILVVSSISDKHLINQILNLDVHGFVSKSESTLEVISAIRSLTEGENYFSKLILQQEEATQEVILTPKEKQVLQLIMEEKSTKQIADDMHLSPKTIELHRSNLFLKTGAKNVAGLVKIAITQNILDNQ